MLKRSASLLRRGRLSWMILECWYSASKMSDMTRLMHSPIPGISFQVVSIRLRRSTRLFLSYFISLSLNSLRMIESPRILVTRNITFSTFPLTFYSMSTSLSSMHLRTYTPSRDTYSRTVPSPANSSRTCFISSLNAVTSLSRCLIFSLVSPCCPSE